jgi:hypothetical protein
MRWTRPPERGTILTNPFTQNLSNNLFTDSYGLKILIDLNMIFIFPAYLLLHTGQAGLVCDFHRRDEGFPMYLVLPLNLNPNQNS